MIKQPLFVANVLLLVGQIWAEAPLRELQSQDGMCSQGGLFTCCSAMNALCYYCTEVCPWGETTCSFSACPSAPRAQCDQVQPVQSTALDSLDFHLSTIRESIQQIAYFNNPSILACPPIHCAVKVLGNFDVVNDEDASALIPYTISPLGTIEFTPGETGYGVHGTVYIACRFWGVANDPMFYTKSMPLGLRTRCYSKQHTNQIKQGTYPGGLAETQEVVLGDTEGVNSTSFVLPQFTTMQDECPVEYVKSNNPSLEIIEKDGGWLAVVIDDLKHEVAEYEFGVLMKAYGDDEEDLFDGFKLRVACGITPSDFPNEQRSLTGFLLPPFQQKACSSLTLQVVEDDCETISDALLINELANGTLQVAPLDNEFVGEAKFNILASTSEGDSWCSSTSHSLTILCQTTFNINSTELHQVLEGTSIYTAGIMDVYPFVSDNENCPIEQLAAYEDAEATVLIPTLEVYNTYTEWSTKQLVTDDGITVWPDEDEIATYKFFIKATAGASTIIVESSLKVICPYWDMTRDGNVELEAPEDFGRVQYVPANDPLLTRFSFSNFSTTLYNVTCPVNYTIHTLKDGDLDFQYRYDAEQEKSYFVPTDPSYVGRHSFALYRYWYQKLSSLWLMHLYVGCPSNIVSNNAGLKSAYTLFVGQIPINTNHVDPTYNDESKANEFYQERSDQAYFKLLEFQDPYSALSPYCSEVERHEIVGATYQSIGDHQFSYDIDLSLDNDKINCPQPCNTVSGLAVPFKSARILFNVKTTFANGNGYFLSKGIKINIICNSASTSIQHPSFSRTIEVPITDEDTVVELPQFTCSNPVCCVYRVNWLGWADIDDDLEHLQIDPDEFHYGNTTLPMTIKGTAPLGLYRLYISATWGFYAVSMPIEFTLEADCSTDEYSVSSSPLAFYHPKVTLVDKQLRIEFNATDPDESIEVSISDRFSQKAMKEKCPITAYHIDQLKDMINLGVFSRFDDHGFPVEVTSDGIFKFERPSTNINIEVQISPGDSDFQTSPLEQRLSIEIISLPYDPDAEINCARDTIQFSGLPMDNSQHTAIEHEIEVENNVGRAVLYLTLYQSEALSFKMNLSDRFLKTLPLDKCKITDYLAGRIVMDPSNMEEYDPEIFSMTTEGVFSLQSNHTIELYVFLAVYQERWYTFDNAIYIRIIPDPIEPVQPVDPEPDEPEPVDPEPVEPQPVDPQPIEPTPVDPPTVVVPILPKDFEVESEPNRAPFFVRPPPSLIDLTAEPSSAVVTRSLPAAIDHNKGQEVTIEVLNLPAFASFDIWTFVLTFRLAEVDENMVHELEIILKDDQGASKEYFVGIKVKGPPHEEPTATVAEPEEVDDPEDPPAPVGPLRPHPHQDPGLLMIFEWPEAFTEEPVKPVEVTPASFTLGGQLELDFSRDLALAAHLKDFDPSELQARRKDLLRLTYLPRIDEGTVIEAVPELIDWSLRSWTTESLQLSLQFKNPIFVSSQDQADLLEIEFLQPGLLEGSNRRRRLKLVDSKFVMQVEVPPQAQSVQDAELIEAESEETFGLLKIALLVPMVLMIALSLSMTRVWSMIFALQIIGSLGTIPSLALPANSGSMLHHIASFSTFSSIHPFSQWMVNKFVPNIGLLRGLFHPSDLFFSSMFFVLPATAAILGLEKAMPKSAAVQALKDRCVWSLPIRLQLLGYLSTCLLLFQEGAADGAIPFLVRLVITVGLPGFAYWFLKSRFFDMEEPEFAMRFSSWFQNLNTEKEAAFEFTPLFAARRILVAAALATGNSAVAIAAVGVSSALWAGFIINTRPYQSRIMTFIEATNEVGLLLGSYYCLLQTDFIADPVLKYSIGGAFSSWLWWVVVGNVIAIAHQVARVCYQEVMRTKTAKERKEKELRVLKLPQIQLTNITQENYGLCSVSNSNADLESVVGMTELKVKHLVRYKRKDLRVMDDASPSAIQPEMPSSQMSSGMYEESSEDDPSGIAVPPRGLDMSFGSPELRIGRHRS